MGVRARHRTGCGRVAVRLRRERRRTPPRCTVTRTPRRPSPRGATWGNSVSRTRRLVAPLAFLLILATALPAAAASPLDRREADGHAYKDRLIVTWKGLAPAAVGIDGVRAQLDTARPYRSVVKAKKGESASVAAKLRRDPRVLAVVPDARLTLTDWPADAPPDDPAYADQGYLS